MLYEANLRKPSNKTLRTSPLGLMPLELGPPVGWPLKYRVTGPDISKVREAALQLANIVAESPNTRDVNLTAGEPQETRWSNSQSSRSPRSRPVFTRCCFRTGYQLLWNTRDHSS